MNIKQEVASTLKTVIVSAFTMLLILQAQAWTAPASTAPAGNVAGPITTSATAQTKAGSFTSNGYVQGYTPSTGYYGLLNYGGYGGYFYGSGGIFSQNTSGYYTYLGYPGTSWGVYTNGGTYAGGTEYAADFCLNGSGKCLSQVSSGGSSATNFVGITPCDAAHLGQSAVDISISTGSCPGEGLSTCSTGTFFLRTCVYEPPAPWMYPSYYWK